MITFTCKHTYISYLCVECGVHYGMTEEFDEARRRDGRSFYCLNGHSQSFSNSTKNQLKEAEAKLSLERKNKEYWQSVAEDAEKSVAAQKGVVTRMKNRLSKGVCPHCKRHFKDLHRHLESKHKEEKK